MYFDTINDLENSFPLANVPTNIEFIVGGYSLKGDGGEGTFVWVPKTILTPLLNEDFGIVIWPDNTCLDYGEGYFKRIFSGPINVRWFGAKGDGSTDDTNAVRDARDSSFCKHGGTIYFPRGIYMGAFEFYVSEGEINIMGDGNSSVLKSNSVNPVLRLGWAGPSYYRWAKIYNLAIDGDSKNSDGIMFDDPTAINDDFDDNTPKVPRPDHAGRWIIEKLTIQNCNRGIYKPKGNYGNTIRDCNLEKNNYGYYALTSTTPVVHCGSDLFVGGHLNGNDYAAIYINGLYQYGKFTIDNTIIENNPGFGIYIVLTTKAQMTQGSVEVRNVWMENNRTSSNPIPIPGHNYSGAQIFDYYFEGVRSVSLYDCYVFNIKLIASSVAMYNCRTDNAHWAGNYDIDNASVINAFELRYASGVSENIYVHSISYDGSSDIWNKPETPTSVWGPLRVITQTGTNAIMISQRFYLSGPREFENVSGTGVSVIGYDQLGGILKDGCIRLHMPANDVVRSNNDVFYIGSGAAYYVWSIHAYACTTFVIGDINTVTGEIRTEDGLVLGQIILKPNQWVCSYGVKKLDGPGIPVPVYIYLYGNDNGGSIKICDYQVVKFFNYAEAQSFLNSRAFADEHNTCGMEGESDG